MENKIDPMKFHKRVDELICGWSTIHGHSFKEEELNSLVHLLGDDFKSQAVKIHASGVSAGKKLGVMFPSGIPGDVRPGTVKTNE